MSPHASTATLTCPGRNMVRTLPSHFNLFCGKDKWNWMSHLACLGPVWRNLRRAAHDILMKSTCDRHIPIQRAEAIKLAVDLLDRPEVSWSQCLFTGIRILTLIVTPFARASSPTSSDTRPLLSSRFVSECIVRHSKIPLSRSSTTIKDIGITCWNPETPRRSMFSRSWSTFQNDGPRGKRSVIW